MLSGARVAKGEVLFFKVRPQAAEARLRAFLAVGEVERWIAAQSWEAVPGGWRVRGQLHAWRFRVEPVAGGVRVVMSGGGGEPAAWFVPGRPGPAA
jgi:hypothetical protein